MSTIPEPPTSPPQPSSPAQRSGCLTAFMILAGLILLLPGLCAVIFGIGEFSSSSTDPVVMTLVTVGLILGAVGIGMIWTAIRGRAR
jgi:hypothetical protein